MKYFIDGEKVSTARATEYITENTFEGCDEFDLKALFERAQADNSDGEDARDTLTDIFPLLEMIA